MKVYSLNSCDDHAIRLGPGRARPIPVSSFKRPNIPRWLIVEILNARSQLKLLATSIFSHTFSCVSKRHHCEKNDAQVQRHMALVGHLA